MVLYANPCHGSIVMDGGSPMCWLLSVLTSCALWYYRLFRCVLNDDGPPSESPHNLEITYDGRRMGDDAYRYIDDEITWQTNEERWRPWCGRGARFNYTHKIRRLSLSIARTTSRESKAVCKSMDMIWYDMANDHRDHKADADDSAAAQNRHSDYFNWLIVETTNEAINREWIGQRS